MPDNQDELKLATPFSSIALCFSGGGFRAAAYCLGVLSYLNRIKFDAGKGVLPLLNNVNYIASTSGGTITNLVYSAYLYEQGDEQKAFRACLRKLYLGMDGETVLLDAVTKLADDESWEASATTKQRNVINAFAKVYDDQLFNERTFNVFWNETLKKDFGVCFNATEFTRGISFRFQTDNDRSTFELVGNRYLHFDPSKSAVFGKLKLADILAASSCFPSGFEPILFPGDFAYHSKDPAKGALSVSELQNALLLEEYDGSKAPIKETVALMDGGVADNQALYSVMNADIRRRKKGKAFDLIMINDVTSYFMEPYKVQPETKESWGKKTIVNYLGKLKNVGAAYRKISIGVFALFILSLAGILLANTRGLLVTSYVLFGVSLPCVFLLIYITGLSHGNPLIGSLVSKDPINIKEWVKDKFGLGSNFSDDVLNKLLNYLGTAKLKNLHQLIAARVNSVVTMSVEVNLKHVRRLIYSLFYENKKWDNRRLPNFIYELSFQNMNARKERFHDKDQPVNVLTAEEKKMLLNTGQEIPKIADRARRMGTTLWFGSSDTKEKMLDKIIQCGQFTTCCNLLEYTLILIRQYEDGKLVLSKDALDKLKELKDELFIDWEKFKVDPTFLFQDELRQINEN